MALLGAKTFQNYIGGEWVDAASGETFESVSPATGDVLGTFPRSDAADVGFAHAKELIAASRERAAGVYLVAPFRRPLRVLELLGD